MLKKTETEARSAGKGKNSEKGEPVFPCFRCGICCSGYQIYMIEAEAKIIAENIGVMWETFIDNYLDARWPGIETVILRQVASTCPFLDQPEDSIFGLCRIHECKPFCCRQWQASLDRKECRQGLTRYWGLSVGENGELNGSPEELLCFKTFIDSLSEEEKS